MQECEACLTKWYEDGSLAMPVGAEGRPQEEMPQDLLEALPPVPKLNKLVLQAVADSDETNLVMPAYLVKDWSGKPRVATEFNSFMEKFLQSYKVLEEASLQTAKKDNDKRPGSENNNDPTPHKKKKP